MASPQLEHGHSRLANELLEAQIKNPPASVPAWQVWNWVWRESWGRRGAMNTRPTSVRSLAEATALSKSVAARALASLLEENRLTRNEDGSLSIQKDHEAWREVGRREVPPPAQKQLFLLAENGQNGVPATGTNCPGHRDKLSLSPGQKCPGHRDKSVPATGTRTIRSLKKERKKESTPANFQQNDDSPRLRAKLGDANRPPEEHPSFKTLGFKRRDELTEEWKDNVAKKACRKKCGRTKASDTWPLCRECTVCATCGAKPDGKNKFSMRAGSVTCSACIDEETNDS